jgi:hypothetical protein
VTRRKFLKFIGASGAIVAMGSLDTLREARAFGLWFTPVRIPSPRPIYTVSASWLGSGLSGTGEKLLASPTAELPSASTGTTTTTDGGVADRVLVLRRVEAKSLIKGRAEYLFPTISSINTALTATTVKYSY